MHNTNWSTTMMNRILAAGLLVAATITTPATAEAQAANAPATPAAFRVEHAGTRGRPAMILIPGLLSSGDVWSATTAEFGADYDIHVLTLAGFAGVPATATEPFLATTRDAVIRYIRDNKLDHPVIMGHSLGGFLAFWIAATAPDAVGPIVAVDGVPFLSALGDSTMTADKAKPQGDMMRGAFAAMNEAGMRAQTRMAMMQQVGDTIWFARGAEWGAKSDPRTAANAVAEMMTTDIRGDVARITSPVLLLMSTAGMNAQQRDAVLQSYSAQVRTIRNARVVPVENAHHFIMLDEPAFFYRAVRSFLADAGSAARVTK
jgi:pimeloyl-ACP methyl ester carboxylesterase